MRLELLADLAKLAVFVAAAYLLLTAVARRRWPSATPWLAGHRVAVLGALALSFGAIKLIEDVVALEAPPVDTAVLWLLRERLPVRPAFWALVTLAGSAMVLLPASGLAVLVLAAGRHRAEALLMGCTMLFAPVLAYGFKAAVGRPRPELWEADAVLGSSFPSGHTLNTAAFATAVALCVARFWPRAAVASMALAVAWSCLVGVSRLVLGVHWPSDVLAALCIGMLVPLVLGLWFEPALATPSAVPVRQRTDAARVQREDEA
ncbi:MAG: phosphatase PAP2 family protein [Aquabacterium sp.]